MDFSGCVILPRVVPPVSGGSVSPTLCVPAWEDVVKTFTAVIEGGVAGRELGVPRLL